MQSERRGVIFIFIASLLAASGWIFSKEAIQGLPPFGFIGLRFILASLFILPFSFRQLSKFSRSEVVKSALTGCLLGATLLIWVFAVSISTSLGVGGFILSLSMLFVPLVAMLVFRKQPPRVFWLCAPLAALGMVFLSLSGGSWSFSDEQFVFLLAALAMACHFSVNSKIAKQIPVLALTTVQLFVTGCLGLTLSFFTESWPSEVAPAVFGWLAMSVLLATSLRFAVQTLGQKKASVTSAAMVMMMEPVWIVLLSLGYYGETLSATKLAGCCLILGSLLLFQWVERKKQVRKR
ncbi:DMT family transporter [Veronia pacifica]|uniref:EamA domain-containing protein n=1 Tax=Veronia pacifica TaxID=1080227 RepID=A0A1C3EEW4_9GAMM|nr:DMT family transporter [Veronia pacifica]ODA31797.1 hypothetical protein A8L45_14975 [Veronia pacifica]